MQPAHLQRQHLQCLQQQRVHMHPAQARPGTHSCQRRLPQHAAAAAAASQPMAYHGSSNSSCLRGTALLPRPGAALCRCSSRSSPAVSRVCRHRSSPRGTTTAATPSTAAAVANAAAGLSAAGGLLDMAAVSAATAASFKLLFLCGVVAWMSHRWVMRWRPSPPSQLGCSLYTVHALSVLC